MYEILCFFSTFFETILDEEKCVRKIWTKRVSFHLFWFYFFPIHMINYLSYFIFNLI